MKKIISILLISIITVFCFAETTLSTTFGFANISMKKPKTELILNGLQEGLLNNTVMNWKPFFVTLEIGNIKENGFVFSWDHYVYFIGRFQINTDFDSTHLYELLGESTPGTITVPPTINFDFKPKEIMYGGHLMFGYNFTKNSKFQTNLSAGLGLEIGIFNLSFNQIKNLIVTKDFGDIKEGKAIVALSAPVQFEIKYYFTDNVGISAGTLFIPSYRAIGIITEVPAKINTKPDNLQIGMLSRGFSSSLEIKAGITFKF